LASAVFMVCVIREKASRGRLFRRMKEGAAGTRRVQRKAGIGVAGAALGPSGAIVIQPQGLERLNQVGRRK